MRSIVFCLSCLFCASLNAQKATISTPLSMVVYSGIENPLDIAYPGVSKKDLVLKAHIGCSIAHGSPNFTIIPTPGNNTCSLVLGIRNESKVKWVDTLVIPVWPLPKGEVRFGTLTNGDYPLSDLLSANQITYQSSFYIKDWESNVSITSFRLLVLQTGQMAETLIMGPTIHADTKVRMFKDLVPGDIIVIDAVKIKLFGFEKVLNPLQIRVAQSGEVIEPEPAENNHNNYKLDTLSDTSFLFESYYPDGRIYQQGKVLKETRHCAYHYSNNSYSPSPEPYETLLMALPEGYYPISKWNVFDSAGHHKMTISYIALKDPSEKQAVNNRPSNYTIAPNGECIFYKSDGSIEEIIYYSMGKRK